MPTKIEQEMLELFGKDILFKNDYEVSPSGDYKTLEGLDNLKEAVYRRLITVPGEYIFVPQYGVGVLKYLKQRVTPGLVTGLQNTITEQLYRESRIDSVEEVIVAFEDNVMRISIILKVSGRTVKFRPFQFKELQ